MVEHGQLTLMGSGLLTATIVTSDLSYLYPLRMPFSKPVTSIDSIQSLLGL